MPKNRRVNCEQLTKQWIKKQFPSAITEIVERQTGPIKRDCFGIADLISVGISWGTPTVFIQTSVVSLRNDRRGKIIYQHLAHTRKIITAGNDIWLILWRNKTFSLTDQIDHCYPIIEKIYLKDNKAYGRQVWPIKMKQ